MKKILKFKLTQPMRLIPIIGETDVTVESENGDFEVSECQTSVHRIRSVVMIETENGCLTRSPQGYYRTVKLRLPAEKASREAFHEQLEILFDNIMINNI